MDNIWVLVANASVATVYNFVSHKSSQQKPNLEVVEQFQHPDSRKKDQDLVSDRMGDYQSRNGAGRGSFVENSDPHQYEAEVFARELVHFLEKGRTAHKFASLMLVAEPHFMGLLRKCMDDHPLKHLPIKEVLKEYTQEKPDQLLTLLKLTHS